MLNMQTKINAFSEPTAFIVTDHDATEFNSMSNEMKNQILDMGGTLTPTIDFGTEDIHQMSKSNIAGSGFIYNTLSQLASNITFTQAGASNNALPTLVSIDGKRITYICSIENNDSTGFTVTWDGETPEPLVNTDGSTLKTGQFQIGMVVTIYHTGSNWILISAISHTKSTSFLGPVGLGGIADAAWVTGTPKDSIQHALGGVSALRTSESIRILNEINNGFQTVKETPITGTTTTTFDPSATLTGQTAIGIDPATGRVYAIYTKVSGDQFVAFFEDINDANAIAQAPLFNDPNIGAATELSNKFVIFDPISRVGFSIWLPLNDTFTVGGDWYRSQDSQAAWTQVPTALSNLIAAAVLTPQGILFAGNASATSVIQTFLADNLNKEIGSLTAKGSTSSVTATSRLNMSYDFDADRIIMCTETEIFFSDNAATSWTLIDISPLAPTAGVGIRAFGVGETGRIVLVTANRIFTTDNLGSSFEERFNAGGGGVATTQKEVVHPNGRIYLSNGGELFTSDDDGTTWTQLVSGFTDVNLIAYSPLNDCVVGGAFTAIKTIITLTAIDQDDNTMLVDGIPVKNRTLGGFLNVFVGDNQEIGDDIIWSQPQLQINKDIVRMNVGNSSFTMDKFGRVAWGNAFIPSKAVVDENVHQQYFPNGKVIITEFSTGGGERFIHEVIGAYPSIYSGGITEWHSLTGGAAKRVTNNRTSNLDQSFKTGPISITRDDNITWLLQSTTTAEGNTGQGDVVLPGNLDLTAEYHFRNNACDITLANSSKLTCTLCYLTSTTDEFQALANGDIVVIIQSALNGSFIHYEKTAGVAGVGYDLGTDFTASTIVA